MKMSQLDPAVSLMHLAGSILVCNSHRPLFSVTFDSLLVIFIYSNILVILIHFCPLYSAYRGLVDKNIWHKSAKLKTFSRFHDSNNILKHLHNVKTILVVKPAAPLVHSIVIQCGSFSSSSHCFLLEYFVSPENMSDSRMSWKRHVDFKYPRWWFTVEKSDLCRPWAGRSKLFLCNISLNI